MNEKLEGSTSDEQERADREGDDASLPSVAAAAAGEPCIDFDDVVRALGDVRQLRSSDVIERVILSVKSMLEEARAELDANVRAALMGTNDKLVSLIHEFARGELRAGDGSLVRDRLAADERCGRGAHRRRPSERARRPAQAGRL